VKGSEKRLLIMFLVMLAVVVGMILSQKLLSWQRSVLSQGRALAAERMESELLLAEAPVWTERGKWLAANQPVAKNDLDADNDLFETLLAKAQAAGVSVVAKQFQEQVKNEYFQQYGVTLTVNGELANVFRWIYSVQSPQAFRVVPYLKITPDKDDAAKVVCAVQFWRWYQPVATKST
jgi:hypothetical protein